MATLGMAGGGGTVLDVDQVAREVTRKQKEKTNARVGTLGRRRKRGKKKDDTAGAPADKRLASLRTRPTAAQFSLGRWLC